jgi:hypothetical protein
VKPPPVPFNDKTRELLRLLGSDPVLREAMYYLARDVALGDLLLAVSRMDEETYNSIREYITNLGG